MRVAVILSTYNAPDRLIPTLVGYAGQHAVDFELVVADDGSTGDTRGAIREIAESYHMTIRHVWQPDAGFRKCRILNQAVLATQADYLVFSDGDCIPRADFVATHVTSARRNRFLSGGYFKLPPETTRQVTPEAILKGQVTDANWLVAHGTPRCSKLRKLRAQGWRAKLMNAITPTRATWNGHNSSCWRDDLLRVNGYDERMAYWAQDREFGERLVNAGVLGLQIRYSAICVHLHHERPYKTEVSRERNREIRAETRARRATWTPYGIHKSDRHSKLVAEKLEADVTVETFGLRDRRRSAA